MKPLKFSFILLLLIFISALSWWSWATAPLDKDSTQAQMFVIPKGQAIDTMGKRLKQDNLIRSSAAFKIMVVKDNLSTKIQAGSFRLKPSMNLKDLTQSLTRGTLDIWVTLLEGWRREQMAEELEEQFADLEAEFNTQQFLSLTKNQEGYLFPDTYLFPRDASASTIVNLLTKTFDQKVDFSNNSSGLTQKQVIVMASILEREVRTDKDRPIIAGILLKRLNNDWPLQADATVQYFMGNSKDWWPQNITRADINTASKYNTYKNQGLPPAPICNPGIASIEAVLNPKDSPYWFYISDLKGNIHYGKTIEEHNANIAKYLNK